MMRAPPVSSFASSLSPPKRTVFSCCVKLMKICTALAFTSARPSFMVLISASCPLICPRYFVTFWMISGSDWLM